MRWETDAKYGAIQHPGHDIGLAAGLKTRRAQDCSRARKRCGWCLGGQQFQGVATFDFEFVAVGRFLALDAVLGPRYGI